MTKISFITFGCSMNFSDSEVMMGLLSEEGYTLVPEPDDADLIIINSCTVKNLAETKFFRTINKLKKDDKKIVVTGCIAQAEQDYTNYELKDISIVGTKQISKICHAVQETLEGNIVHLLKQESNPRLNLPKIRKNQVIGIVPISEGCLGDCSYCKTRFARGTLKSYDPLAIIKQVKNDIEDGCKEIWLTSQDCGAYGKDIDTNIIELLRKILDIKKDFHIRIGMMNPNFAFEYLEPLLDIFKDNLKQTSGPLLFQFLHIPVQAGNNKILASMKRKYNIEQYTAIIKKFRKDIPLFTFATDIICGFPGETKEQFNDSLNLIEQTTPDVMNISRFWARPGTDAANLPDQLHGRETNERSRLMKELKDNISFRQNKLWEDKTTNILIDEKGKVGTEESWIGRNRFYKPVAVKGKHNLGDILKVNLKKAHDFYLEAEIPN